jgi:hypothetical protein
MARKWACATSSTTAACWRFRQIHFSSLMHSQYIRVDALFAAKVRTKRIYNGGTSWPNLMIEISDGTRRQNCPLQSDDSRSMTSTQSLYLTLSESGFLTSVAQSEKMMGRGFCFMSQKLLVTDASLGATEGCSC